MYMHEGCNRPEKFAATVICWGFIVQLKITVTVTWFRKNYTANTPIFRAALKGTMGWQCSTTGVLWAAMLHSYHMHKVFAASRCL